MTDALTEFRWAKQLINAAKESKMFTFFQGQIYITIQCPTKNRFIFQRFMATVLTAFYVWDIEGTTFAFIDGFSTTGFKWQQPHA